MSISCPTLDNIAKLSSDLSVYSESDIIECRKINHAKYAKNKRLSNAIGKMISFAEISGNDLLFLTLTFNDDSLSLQDNVRRKYVAQKVLPIT